MPLSTFVTFRFLSNLTVTREPSAFFMCTSYTPSPASVSIRYTVPPGTALSAAARSVAAVALDTLFSSGRTGWAPPGPGVLASPLADDTVLALAVDVLLEADALSALARTPPPIAPAANRPTAPTHLFLRPPTFAESYVV